MLAHLVLRGKATTERAPDLFSLAGEMLTSVNFNQQRRALEMIKEMIIELEAAVVSSGHRCSCYLSSHSDTCLVPAHRIILALHLLGPSMPRLIRPVPFSALPTVLRVADYSSSTLFLVMPTNSKADSVSYTLSDCSLARRRKVGRLCLSDLSKCARWFCPPMA
jgi:hypothetical protein